MRLAPPVGNEKFWVSQRGTIWKTRSGKKIALGDLWGIYNKNDPDKSQIYQLPIQTRVARGMAARFYRGWRNWAKRSSPWNILGPDETMRVASDLGTVLKHTVNQKVLGRFVRRVNKMITPQRNKEGVLQKDMIDHLWQPVLEPVLQAGNRIWRAASRAADRAESGQMRTALPATLGSAAVLGGAAGLYHMHKKDKQLGAYRIPAAAVGLTPAQQALLVKDGKPVHEKLVEYVVSRYAKPGVSRDDLVAAGNIGLVEAAHRYNPAKGKFSTYAVPRIRNAVQQELGRGFLIRVPKQQLGKVELPGIAPIEAAYDRAGPAYFEPDYRLLQVDAHKLRRVNVDIIKRRIKQLPAVQHEIIRARYLSPRPMQNQDIARRIGLTPGRVSQLHREALQSLQKGLRG